MQYLIDGHNLIPKVRGLSLADPDDEEQLVARLSGWARVSKHKVTVFFDRAPQGKAGTRGGSPVTAIFVRDGKTADTAIMQALAKLGNAAKNVIVVSSDRQVKAAAQEAHAKVLKSEDFANELLELRVSSTSAEDSPTLTPSEIADWENLFSSKKR